MTQIIDDWQLENTWADEATKEEVRQKILNDYYQRWKKPEFNPETHPWLFDPLSPPTGWRYDPYYELWIQK
jgi:hypothetical protein